MMNYQAVTMQPNQYDDWYHLVRSLVEFATTRYGIKEVQKWAFEVWNELWGMPFPQAYMQLYNASARAVKSVDESLKVGGPATSQLEGSLGGIPAFVQEATQQGLPFDFVSTHFYPSSGKRSAFKPCAGGDQWDPSCFAKQMRKAKESIPKETPLYLTEYNAGCCLGYFQHDTSGGAAFAFRSVGELAGVTDVLSWWTFSDVFEEGGLPKQEFSNVYGAMTYHGVPKPAWRAFGLLHEHAGTQRVPAVVTEHQNISLVSAFATVKAAGSPPTVFISFWENGGSDMAQLNRSVTITIDGAAVMQATEYRIDEDHANPLRAWQAMGAPDVPSESQLDELVEASQVKPVVVNVTSGTCTVSLSPNSAVVLVFKPAMGTFVV